jgi:hypothetical protein
VEGEADLKEVEKAKIEGITPPYPLFVGFAKNMVSAIFWSDPA